MNIAQIKTNKQTKQTNIVNKKKQAVPAYDDNWSSCFNVPCKWYQAEEMRHCLRIFFDVVHCLSYYNRPCFVAFLSKKYDKFVFIFRKNGILTALLWCFFFFKYYILTPSLVISILLLLISVVCSCCNFAVKGVTCFELVAVGSHIPACKKESLTDLFEIISNFIFRKGKQISLKFCLIKIRRIFNIMIHTDSTLQNGSKQTTTSES